jgi:hypothetical protein
MISTNYIKLSIWILAICAITSTKCIAQPDSMYICKYEQKLTIKGFIYSNYLKLSTGITTGTKEVNYIPNNPMDAGIGLNCKKLPFEISFGYNIGVKEDENYLKTKYFDLQLHKYAQMYVADVFIQQYKGLYIDDPKLSVEESNCFDLSILHAGLVGQYLFNGKKFSYQAAFNQSEKQLKSAGSLLVGAGLYYFRINSDSSFVIRNENNIQSFQWGINAGYAYNWVIKKHWIACGSLTAGVNLGNDNIKSFFNNYLYVNPTLLTRTSVFYNSENWSLGISFIINMMTLMYSKDPEVDLSGGRCDITYVQRINLKKDKKYSKINK